MAMKTISLLKGNHHYCFRYEVGEEAKVLEHVEEDFRRGIYKWHVRDGRRYDPPLILGPNGGEPGEDPDFDQEPGSLSGAELDEIQRELEAIRKRKQPYPRT